MAPLHILAEELPCEEPSCQQLALRTWIAALLAVAVVSRMIHGVEKRAHGVFQCDSRGAEFAAEQRRGERQGSVHAVKEDEFEEFLWETKECRHGCDGAFVEFL